MFQDFLIRGANQIWTGDRGVADLCLTTWVWRLSDSKGIWTPVTAVKGRCLNRLTMEPNIQLLSYLQNYIYKTETMQTLAAPLISQLLVKPSTD